jgi:hypothetical protein
MASSATTQSQISGAESLRLPESINYQQGSIIAVCCSSGRKATWPRSRLTKARG